MGNNNNKLVKCYNCSTNLEISEGVTVNNHVILPRPFSINIENKKFPIAVNCVCGEYLCIPGNWSIVGSRPGSTQTIINNKISSHIDVSEYKCKGKCSWCGENILILGSKGKRGTRCIQCLPPYSATGNHNSTCRFGIRMKK
uniref:Uncharacterized protein n=1 Tax=Pithovirus LCPAC101 TaxID=2506586 RepID=A0A481Z5X5_9VIRU|nr:MAG: hypothetical protein LCPAC101_03250 [Pithovirus LCPAC101]